MVLTLGAPRQKGCSDVPPVAPAAGWISGSYLHHLKELMDKKILLIFVICV